MALKFFVKKYYGVCRFDYAEEGLFVLEADEESGMSLVKVDAGRSSFSSVATSGNFRRRILAKILQVLQSSFSNDGPTTAAEVGPEEVFLCFSNNFLASGKLTLLLYLIDRTSLSSLHAGHSLEKVECAALQLIQWRRFEHVELSWSGPR